MGNKDQETGGGIPVIFGIGPDTGLSLPLFRSLDRKEIRRQRPFR